MYEDQKVNVGMIRINKKVKKVKDLDADVKKIDENHELDGDILGTK